MQTDRKGLGPEDLFLAPIACAVNPICRVRAMILGQRIASSFIISNAVANQNTPLLIAASNEQNPAYVASGLMCGAIKGALPDGVISPGIPLPTLGSEVADQAGELRVGFIKDFEVPGQSPLPYTPTHTN